MVQCIFAGIWCLFHLICSHPMFHHSTRRVSSFNLAPLAYSILFTLVLLGFMLAQQLELSHMTHTSHKLVSTLFQLPTGGEPIGIYGPHFYYGAWSSGHYSTVPVFRVRIDSPSWLVCAFVIPSIRGRSFASLLWPSPNVRLRCQTYSCYRRIEQLGTATLALAPSTLVYIDSDLTRYFLVGC